MHTSSQSADLAKSWWAGRWMRALAHTMDASRLARGRMTTREDRAIQLKVQVGLVLALVQDSRPEPHSVRFEIRTLSEAEWDKAILAMASQAFFAAQLLNGEMPHGIEESFNSAGISLFPRSASELKTVCSCPDPIAPCKHVASVLLLLGEMLDADPFLLFALRGRTREQIMSALREKRADRATVPLSRSERSSPSSPSRSGSEPPLEECLDRFWDIGPEMQQLKIQVAPPDVELETLKVLGDPLFAEDSDLRERLAQAYSQVSRQALAVAFRDSAHETPAQRDDATDSQDQGSTMS